MSQHSNINYQELYDSLVLHDKNKGKGAAIKSGIEKIEGDIKRHFLDSVGNSKLAAEFCEWVYVSFVGI